jgi:hypothetical protein
MYEALKVDRVPVTAFESSAPEDRVDAMDQSNHSLNLLYRRIVDREGPALGTRHVNLWKQVGSSLFAFEPSSSESVSERS